MAEPMTIYVCSEGHVTDALTAESGCELCYESPRPVEVVTVDEHTGELEALREQMSGEISVRQSELDDIAELVGVPMDAPYAAVRDKVAQLARASDQLRMT